MDDDKIYIVDLDINDIIRHYKPYELRILLFGEPDIIETDKFLDWIEEQFVNNESYEFAVVIRDEKLRRKRKELNGTKSKI